MNDARKRRFDRVLVGRFHRFARSTKHLLLALEEFPRWEFSSSAFKKTSTRHLHSGKHCSQSFRRLHSLSVI